MDKARVKIFADARFAFRSDTAENWEKNNPVLLSGEPGVVIGLKSAGDGLNDPTKYIKFGDGINAWCDLPWWMGTEGPRGENGIDGENYILTEEDKTEIAETVIAYTDDRIGDINSVLSQLVETEE